MRGNHRPCDDGRNPVGVADRARGVAAREGTQGCPNPGLKYGTPLALECTNPDGVVELSPGFVEPWAWGQPAIQSSWHNPDGVVSDTRIIPRRININDGRNPVGVAGGARDGGARWPQGCSNPGLKSTSPLGLADHERQRRSVFEPRVGAKRLPWAGEPIRNIFLRATPTGLRPSWHHPTLSGKPNPPPCHNPSPA